MANMEISDVVQNDIRQNNAKKKNFGWSDEMIEQLIDSLTIYKTEMEFKGLDFDADKCMQYRNVRMAMAKLYSNAEEPNFLCFGPVSPPDIPENFGELPEEEQKAINSEIKASKDLITKAHKRVVEKVKEIRQNYSKAVVSGRRSGSGKIIYEHYDKLVQIWGSSPNVAPLQFGVNGDIFTPLEVQNVDENVSLPRSRSNTPGTDSETAIESLDISECPSVDLDESHESEFSLPDETNSKKTPKRKRRVERLVDNKRKHLKRTLSAAQRDKILIDEAKDDAQFRKELTQVLRESTECFSNGVKELSAAMLRIGTGISQSTEMLTNAILQQQQQPFNFPQYFHQGPHFQRNPQFPQGNFSEMASDNTFSGASNMSGQSFFK